jgi:inner membrane protein
MLFKTHIAITIFLVLILITFVNSKIIFCVMAFIGTGFVDIDLPDSKFGRNFIFRIIQFFSKHRGFFHSITSAVLFSLAIAIIWPVASLGFFLGYSSHLIADSFTLEGIKPFWPFKFRSSGFIKTGGKFEWGIFILFAIFDTLIFTYLLSTL